MIGESCFLKFSAPGGPGGLKTSANALCRRACQRDLADLASTSPGPNAPSHIWDATPTRRHRHRTQRLTPHSTTTQHHHTASLHSITAQHPTTGRRVPLSLSDAQPIAAVACRTTASQTSTHRAACSSHTAIHLPALVVVLPLSTALTTTVCSVSEPSPLSLNVWTHSTPTTVSPRSCA